MEIHNPLFDDAPLTSAPSSGFSYSISVPSSISNSNCNSNRSSSNSPQWVRYQWRTHNFGSCDDAHGSDDAQTRISKRKVATSWLQRTSHPEILSGIFSFHVVGKSWEK